MQLANKANAVSYLLLLISFPGRRDKMLNILHSPTLIGMVLITQVASMNYSDVSDKPVSAN